MIYYIHIDATHELVGEFIAPDIEPPYLERKARQTIVDNGFGHGKTQLYAVSRGLNRTDLAAPYMTFKSGFY